MSKEKPMAANPVTIEAGDVTQVAATKRTRKPPAPTAPAQTQALATSPSRLIEMAITKGVDTQQLTALMDLQERWERNEARKASVVAMNEFKKAAPEITKNKTVSFPIKDKQGNITGSNSYTHATLDQVCEAVIQKLSEHGVSHRWKTEQPNGKVRVTCILTHAMGHSEETSLEGPPDDSGYKNPVQAICSTVTYLERYTLLAAVGLAVAGSDDDGKGGGTDLGTVACPECGKTGVVIASKEEWGGGYVCHKKRGGCGHKFQHLPGSEAAKEAEKKKAEGQAFSGKVLELTVRHKEGKPVLKLRLDKVKLEFWVVDAELRERLSAIPDGPLKEQGLEIAAVQRAGTKKWWEVIQIRRVPKGYEAAAVDPQAVADQMTDPGNKASVAAEAERQNVQNPAHSDVPPVVVTDEDVPVMVGTGENKEKKIQHWKKLVGRVKTIAGTLAHPLIAGNKQKSPYLQIVVEGLPPGKEKKEGEEYKPGMLFHCFRKTLFEAIAVMPGEICAFYFDPAETRGTYWQSVEDVLSVGDLIFENGRVVTPVESAVEPKTIDPGPTTSPKGLFS
jgi:hypothetical protein